ALGRHSQVWTPPPRGPLAAAPNGRPRAKSAAAGGKGPTAPGPRAHAKYSATSSTSSFSASPFEGELGAGRLVQLPLTGGDEPVVLVLRGLGQGEAEPGRAGELEGDPGVLRGVGGGEVDAMIPVLHVLAV